MSTWMSLLATPHSVELLVLRLALALVIFPHGAQKVMGWFGGYGFAGTMGYFSQTLGLPRPLGWLAIAAEFGGSLMLAVGAGTRLAAMGIGITMLVAALKVHTGNGFFMNWSGQQKGEGYEFHILAAAMALILVLSGGGAWSIDALLAH